MKFVSALFALSALVVVNASVELTVDNWDTETAGKVRSASKSRNKL
jgi:hypothetical protein